MNARCFLQHSTCSHPSVLLSSCCCLCSRFLLGAFVLMDGPPGGSKHNLMFWNSAAGVVCDTGWILTNTSVHAFICFALHESYLRLSLCLSFLKALWQSFPLGCPFLLFCLVFWSPDWFPFCDNKVWSNYWSFWELCDPDGRVSFSVHIVMQSMKRDGLLGMSVRYCQPTASQDGENLVLTFAPCRWNLYDADGLSVIFPCDTFLYLMYFFFLLQKWNLYVQILTGESWREKLYRSQEQVFLII